MKKDKFKRTKRKKDLDDFPRRKKFCRFCKDKTYSIDYKSMNTLERMISERGKILSRRVTGNCAKHQRKICAAIKRARFLSLIPYTR
ncbi:30S ribosomal protein S18 [Candidatus Omnitrophota bacterium]